jgi:TnpA family transposase
MGQGAIYGLTCRFSELIFGVSHLLGFSYAPRLKNLKRWDDILRLIATIKLKETTASEIFRRLNSYSQQHALYRAR